MEEDSPFKESVNHNEVAEFLNRNLRTIGLADALTSKGEGGKDANDVVKPDPELEEDPESGEETTGEPTGTDGEDDGVDSGVF